MASSPPKRKRDQLLPLDTKGPIARVLEYSDLDDGGSPRTKVARQMDDLEINEQILDTSDNTTTLQEQPPRATDHSTDTHIQERVIASPKTPRKRLKLSADSPGKPSSSITTTATTTTQQSLGLKSPPLSTTISPDFWHDSEITGHDPSDPEDDGQGINGIGFRPTAAEAWSRSQRRKDQINEWRNREAREARQQRSQRRKRGSGAEENVESAESSPRKAVKVHFADG